MNLKKINFNKIKSWIKQALNILAERASLFFLFLIILYFISGGVLIYKYSVLAQRTEIYTTEKKQNFLKENAYKEILEHWESTKIKFDEINEKNYPNPFIEKARQELDEQPAEANDDLPANASADLSAVAPAVAPAGAKEGAKEEAEAEAEEKTQPLAGNEAKKEPIAESFFGKINTLFDYYTSQRKNFLSVDERAKIWEQEGFGKIEEYHGFYNQNINLLEQLTK